MSDPTTGRAWHAGPDLLRQYGAGMLDPVGQAAIETHVERCTDCRSAASTLVTPLSLAPVWDRVLETVRAPQPAWPFRMLRRLGVPEADLVVLRTSSHMVVAVTTAAAAALCFALAAAQVPPPLQAVLWLAIAPLLPALLVAGAYDSTDPLRELAEPTPYSKLRIALLRTVMAVMGALPLVLAMSLVPHIDVSVATWLLPTLAIVCVLLVLLTWLRPVLAVSVVGGSWLLAVGGLKAGDQVQAVSAPLGQSLSLLVVIVAVFALAHRMGVLRVETRRA